MLSVRDFTGWGLLASLVVWVLIMLAIINGADCLESKRQCQGDDLFITGILAVTAAVPSYFIGLLFSHKKRG